MVRLTQLIKGSAYAYLMAIKVLVSVLSY